MSKKILVVDDSPTIREMIKGLLEKIGYEIEMASDGFEALEVVKKVLPDLIILDVNMPKMDGFRVCRLLKFDRNFRNIPIIMLTARDEEENIKIGIKTGADLYLTKPIEPEKLIEAVNKFLHE
ncbi:MAG: response regulator [Actinobacteria bacterium]|nr:response regulator [Actinomycetota bacterium]